MIIELISLAVVVCHKVIVPGLACSAWALYSGLRQISDHETKKTPQTQAKQPSRSTKIQHHTPTTSSNPPVNPPSSPPIQPQPLPSGWVKPETRNRLFAMCGGDEELVRRLTGGSGCQADWEKAIYYLERDRR
jgi:hypothetical protein